MPQSDVWGMATPLCSWPATAPASLPALSTASAQVRLEHMLQRLRVLQQASLTGRPVRLMQRLYLSGAGGEWVVLGGLALLSCFPPALQMKQANRAYPNPLLTSTADKLIHIMAAALQWRRPRCTCCATWASRTCSTPPRWDAAGVLHAACVRLNCPDGCCCIHTWQCFSYHLVTVACPPSGFPLLGPLQDLLLPEEGQGFVTHRVPLRDVEEEDLAPHLPGKLWAAGLCRRCRRCIAAAALRGLYCKLAARDLEGESLLSHLQLLCCTGCCCS